MLFFLPLLPLLAAENCPPPEILDHTKARFRYRPEDEDFYVPGSVLSFNCRYAMDSLNRWGIHDHSRTCLDNGTWSGEPLICGIDVAKNFPLEDISNQCTDYTPLSNTSCTQKRVLNFIEPTDIEGIKLIFNSSKDTDKSDIKIEVESTEGRVPCSFRQVSTNWGYSHCPVKNIRSIEISQSSNQPIEISDLQAISLTSGLMKSPPTMEIVVQKYALSKEKRIYVDAKKVCEENGGTILDEFEKKSFDILHGVFKKIQARLSVRNRRNRYSQPKWIGLKAVDNMWEWESGKLFTQFQSVNVTGSPSNGKAVVMGSKLYSWVLSSADQTQQNYFICQLNQPDYICPWPGSPKNGKIAEIEENSHVTYRCVDGYKLVGNATRTCNKETGQYDQRDLPECVKGN